MDHQLHICILQAPNSISFEKCLDDMCSFFLGAAAIQVFHY